MAFNLDLIGSLWNRSNRNIINTNFVILRNFLKEFDGTRLMEVSYNLFDKSRAGDGSISTVNGSVGSDGFKNTGFIALKPNTTYQTTAKGAGALYDINQQFVRGVNSSTTSFTTNSTEYFFRATLGIYQLDTFMIHEGDALLPYMPYGVRPAPLIIDENLKKLIEEANETFEVMDGLTINRGKDYPLKSVQLGSQEPVEIPEVVQNIVLGAVVSGAEPDMYYRVTFVANGIVQGGEPRYGITVEERRKSDGWRTRFVFIYNDASTPENQQNYNIEKHSDGIDTIIADRGDLVISVTVDRQAITNSHNPTFLNLNSGASSAPSAVIDPAVYTSF